jgi:electron transport complex protein RnfD
MKPFNSTSQMMRHLIYALILGIMVQFYFYGWSVIVQIGLAITTALFFEALVLKLRKKDLILKTIFDGSAIVTALLLALAIPSIASWWVIVLGIFFAIIFGKHLYGGLGHNPFNPAMLAYVFLLVSFPLEMTRWQSEFFMPLLDAFKTVFLNIPIDAITSATQLEKFVDKYSASFFINLAFLVGGLYLLARKVIYWHIPTATLLSISIFAFIFNLDVSFHLLTGATMLGAFFIATDPVTAATTVRGRLIFGVLCGFIVIIIRKFGNYPDGFAFAILLANLCVPMIDYYSQSKILGEK